MSGRMQIDYVTLYAFMVLISYFMFLSGIFYTIRNVQNVAYHPLTEALADKVHYNLRDIPRVDYTEPSSDSDSSDSFEETEESTLKKRHHDRNPMSRLMEID